MDRERLPKTVLGRVIFRSFFLQASWSFERMQSLGFLFAVLPALRLLYAGEGLAAACRRHLDYFNTHPFMAAPVLGTTLALEELEKRGEPGYLGVTEFKKMVMAPYAAMGDALFWGGVRPVASGAALFFAIRGSLLAPIVFLLLFNLPHLWFRCVGVTRGYALGLKVVEIVQKRRLPDIAIRLKEGMVVLLGGLCAYLTFLCLRAEELAPGWGLAAMPFVVLGGKLVRKGLSTLLIVFSVAVFILFFISVL